MTIFSKITPPTQEQFIQEQKTRFRLVIAKIVNIVAAIFLITLAPIGFGMLYSVIDPHFFGIYIFYLVSVFISAIFIAVMIHKKAGVLLRKPKIIQRITWFSILSLSIVNVILTMSSSYFGMDMISIGFSVITFATMFLLTDRERAAYVLYYLVIASVGYHFISSDDIFITGNTILTFAAFGILIFIIGHIIYRNWKSYTIQLYDNQIMIHQLADKQNQQIETFRELSEAISVIEMHDAPMNLNATTANDTLQIGRKTKELLKEFKHTQHLFKEALIKYEDIFENVSEGIVLLDKSLSILDINSAGRRIFGLHESNEYLNLADFLSPEDKTRFLAYISDMHDQCLPIELTLTTSRKKIKTVEISCSLIVKDGVMQGTRNIVRDISDRKEAEREIERARSSEKEFLAKISHEIRTPLNAIIGMSQMLYETDPSSEQKEQIDIINHSSIFLLALINNILDLAKIEAGKMELNLKPFRLGQTIHVVHQTFALRAKEKNLQFDFQPDPALDKVWLGDELIINQVLFNLLSNAEKFTHDGKIKLATKMEPMDQDKFLVRIEVEDTGSGIPPKELERIFDRFTQVHDRNQIQELGSGLGLTLCKELVEIHGGTIRVESQLGQGSKFIVELPLSEASGQYEGHTPSSFSAHKLNRDCSSIQILIAEDNEFNVAFISRIMKKNGLAYDLAKNGEEAVKLAESKAYDIILMDLEMPVMNGYEASSLIKNTTSLNSDTPIIALTASDVHLVKIKALEAGMDDMLNKPFQSTVLLRLIRHYCMMNKSSEKQIA